MLEEMETGVITKVFHLNEKGGGLSTDIQKREWNTNTVASCQNSNFHLKLKRTQTKIKLKKKKSLLFNEDLSSSKVR